MWLEIKKKIGRKRNKCAQGSTDFFFFFVFIICVLYLVPYIAIPIEYIAFAHMWSSPKVLIYTAYNIKRRKKTKISILTQVNV